MMYILFDNHKKCYCETMVDSPVFPYVGFATIENLLKFYEMDSINDLKAKLYPNYTVHKIKFEVEEIV